MTDKSGKACNKILKIEVFRIIAAVFIFKYAMVYRATVYSIVNKVLETTRCTLFIGKMIEIPEITLNLERSTNSGYFIPKNTKFSFRKMLFFF